MSVSNVINIIHKIHAYKLYNIKGCCHGCELMVIEYTFPNAIIDSPLQL